MKKISKNIFMACALLLLAAGAAMPSTAKAQAKTEGQSLAYYGGQKIQVGDTVRIHQDSLYYLTGERMAKWVYKKLHTVRQIGGRRYPHGVLLKEIYSWVNPEDIYPITPKVPTTDTINVVTCEKYYWGATGHTYTTSGEYTFKTKAVNGCDSTIILFLTINPTQESTIIEAACREFYWDATGETYTESGEYKFTTTSECGCDSIVTLRLNVRKPTTSDVTVEIRPRQLPYLWRGILMQNVGDTSRIAGQDIHGCDSIEILHLKFRDQKRWGQPVEPVVSGWTINVPYHVDRFSVGVRGGFASNFAGDKLPLGGSAMLDLNFAHYWVKGENKTAFGLKTGLAFGYMHTIQEKVPALQNYTESIVPALGKQPEQIQYTVSVDNVKQTTNQLQLEVPVMFAMQTPKGFFLNAGPKVVLPVYSKYHQILTNPIISVTGLAELPGVNIQNEAVYGKVSPQQADYKGNFLVDNPCQLFSLALGAELGYNIKLKQYGHSIDLGLFADYSVINAYKNNAEPTGKVISVTPPSYNSSAIVDVQSLSSAYSNKHGFMNVGLKVAYNFDANYFFK